MKFVLFCHSFSSCWNHGNAHFLRGVTRELIGLGHHVTIYEPEAGWSRVNALGEPAGAEALAEAAALVPGVCLQAYGTMPDLDRALDGADVVIAHEWNEPELFAALSRRRIEGGGFLLLFHDTHHRAVTAPRDLERFDLGGFDGVLAFGGTLREIYAAHGWGNSAFIWHEAADVALFHPLPLRQRETDVIFIGNWGDEERTQELKRFLFDPVCRLGLRGRVHGVRYPETALAQLEASGFGFGGWLPNHRVPRAFAKAEVTVHVPRRAYVEALPGIPTIRVFEALACGIPLISAPWPDVEGLFPERSYLAVRDGDEAAAALSLLLRDREFAASLAAEGLRCIRARHSCAHRARELIEIVDRLGGRPAIAPCRPIRSESRVMAS